MIPTEVSQECYAAADIYAATGYFLIGLAVLSVAVYLVVVFLRTKND